MASAMQVELEQPNVERFRRDLDALVAKGAPIGIAVSGGPDSLALLLLAATARPGEVEAATVDHSLREESRAEAEMVAALCERLDVPHSILTVEWGQKPATGLQERARAARYGLLAAWARERGLRALLTAHHLDDQAETVFMRLVRGSGISGLAGMRRVAPTPGSDVPLVRPLLGWRRSELEQVCAEAQVAPIMDPSNEDEQFERVRTRRALAEADWLDPRAIALSAAHLGEADAALRWATTQAWDRSVITNGREIVFAVAGVPREIRRRIVTRSITALANEGQGSPLRGGELNRLLSVLASGGRATIRGVLCSGGPQWRFAKAPPRR